MILGDYHTHTTNSDGKGRLEDTLIAADQRGLLEVGISDHGFGHIVRGMRLKDVERMRLSMDKLADKYKVKCMLSIEANIYDSDGNIDLTEQQRDMFDYILAGYHKAALPRSIRDMFRYNLPAMFANFYKPTNSQRDKYTKTIVKAVQSKKFNILTHLNYGIPCYVAEVGKACIDNNVLIELNGKRVNMTDEEILILYEQGVQFVLNSDAHTPDKVGDVSIPLAVVDRLSIDKSRIVNWNSTISLSVRHD